MLSSDNLRMRIKRLVWSEERVQHMARHAVTPGEVEQACFGDPWVRRGKSEGENPVYYVLGQTHAGRYLFCVVIGFPHSNGYPVIARDMSSAPGFYRRSPARTPPAGAVDCRNCFVYRPGEVVRPEVDRR